MDRRDFLRTAALAAGGLALGRVLQAEAEPDFTFIALADPHLSQDIAGEPTGVAKLERALAAIRALPRQPAFILMLGDIHPDKIAPFMGQWPVPVHPVAGNHENLAHRKALRELFAADFQGRDFYAFTHGDCRFIGLCTAMVGDHVGHFESENITPAVGQVEFLEDELRQARPRRGRFIFAHVPPDQENRPVADCLGTAEARYLHHVMRNARVTACFFGHRHAYRHWQHGETLVYGVPSINWNFGGKPVCFLEVSVYPTEIKTRLVNC